MNKDTIMMDYIGDLSVNQRLGRRKDGGYYLKQSVIDWNKEFAWRVKFSHIEDWKLPLDVTCSGVFKDGRSAPDLNNLIKILDVIQEVTKINDKDMRWHDGSRVIGSKINEFLKPRLFITIEEAK